MSMAQHVHALDDQAAVDDLRLRAVAVARQDAVVRGAAEPEHAQRRLDELVVETRVLAASACSWVQLPAARRAAGAEQL